MNRKLLMALALGTMLQAHAAKTEKHWEKCPGPACPAKSPTPQQDGTILKDDQGKSSKGDSAKSAKPAYKMKREPADKKMKNDASKLKQQERAVGR